MAKNKLVKGKNYISFEKDEKKSIIIALVVSAVVVLAVVIAIICIKRGVGIPVGNTTSEEVIDTYTVTENVTEEKNPGIHTPKTPRRAERRKKLLRSVSRKKNKRKLLKKRARKKSR